MTGFSPSRLIAIAFTIVLVAAVDGAMRPITMPTFTGKPAKQDPVVVSALPAEEGAAPVELTDETLDVEMLRQLIDTGTTLLIDARVRFEFEEGHLPMAQHLVLQDFLSGRPELLELYDPETLVVVYCGGGDCDSSERVREMMQAHGFHNVLVFKPGYPGWVEAGGEVMTP